MVALQPDLVVVTPSRQAANQLIDPMERIGVPIMVLLQRSVPEILDNVRLMGRVAGVPEQGEAVVARFQARLDAVKRKVEGQPAPSTIMITGRLGNGLMLVAREGTYTGDAMVLAGARFALPDTRTLAQVSPEAILNADPDVLLFAGSERDMNELLGRPGWLDLRAVRTRRTHAVSRGEFLIHGFRNRDLRTILYGSAEKSEQRAQAGKVTRLLSILRAHGLIAKVPKTHRYQLTEKGRQPVPPWVTETTPSSFVKEIGDQFAGILKPGRPLLTDLV